MSDYKTEIPCGLGNEKAGLTRRWYQKDVKASLTPNTEQEQI